jgi:hypothetical protein
LQGTVNGWWIRAAGAEEIVCPRRLIGRLWAAPYTSPLGGCLRRAGVTFNEIAIPHEKKRAGGLAMTERTAEQSPQPRARIAGVFYLLTILSGASGLLAAGPLRSAIILGSTACYVVVTVLFYGLFRPVSHSISTIAAVLSLVGCALSILGFFHLDSSHTNPLVFFGCYCLVIGYLHCAPAGLAALLGGVTVLEVEC